MGGKNWFEISGVSKNRRFEKLGIKLHCLTEANPGEMCQGSKNREVQKIEGLKNRNSTVYPKKTGYARLICMSPCFSVDISLYCIIMFFQC